MASCACKEFVEKSGINIESLSKKGNLVEYESDTDIAHFYPSKLKGLKF